MRIGFDAKRLFLNTTGLGNYSRTLLSAMVRRFPEHQYYMFTPKVSPHFTPSIPAAVKTILPARPGHKIFSPAWRSIFLTGDMERSGIDLYHGLSNEIPFGIHKLPVKTVVTVHDVIFERYPQFYNPIDVFIYRKKLQYAVKYADRIIAVSRQTERDLIAYYHVPAEKIRVVYQSCNPVFYNPVSDDERNEIQKRYKLPSEFLLYVGSVVERKNLLTLIKAMKMLTGYPPLVVVGEGKKYMQKTKIYASCNGIGNRIIWLCNHKRIPDDHLASIYRISLALIYPSFFEGFGLPIQEAMWCRTPVITSTGSCFSETGGDAPIYVNPGDTNALAEAIKSISLNKHLAEYMKEKGLNYVQKFTADMFASNIMAIYKELIN